MTNKEFKEMIAITRRLSELIKKYEADFAEEVDAPLFQYLKMFMMKFVI